jgi:hypothetical protein
MGQLSYTDTKIDDLLVRVDKMGWEIAFDNTYTSGSPLTITSGTRQLLPNDGAGANSNNTYLPNGVSALWDTANDKILSGQVGNAFEVRVQFIVDPATTGAFFDLEFDIGTGAPDIVIAELTITAPKGSDPFTCSVAIPLFSLATFVANGCKIYVNNTGAPSIDIYDIQVLVKQDYYA